jgi:hypothetical protein
MKEILRSVLAVATFVAAAYLGAGGAGPKRSLAPV